MALLQISEPGVSVDPHQRRIVVGIDLGTTHSLVAAVRHGIPECLPDAQGKVILPSAVRYGGATDGLQVGGDALAHQVDDPQNTIVSVKRFIGRSLRDIDESAYLSYRFIDRPGMLALETRDGVKSPVEVSAAILAALHERARDTFKEDIDGVVVTVPAYFDDAQRQATKDAAEMAGLRVLRLLNEPTAAAIAYGLDEGVEGLYMIYDLGGGTFDVSLLRLSQGIFEVMATGGDTALGGDDIDRAVVDWALSAAGRRVQTSQDQRSILQAARQIKERLSADEVAESTLVLSDGEFVLRLHRDQLSEIAAPIVGRTLKVLRKVLRDAKLGSDDIDGVVLVGGSTRLRAVRGAVSDIFGEKVLTNLNPDEVVALGAARQASQLAGNAVDGDILLLDVLPLSLGVETMGGLVERIVPRNTPIPCSYAQEFTTFKDGQTAMSLHVVQGERELVSDCRSLARFELQGIPPMVAGAARIRVVFQVDADGLLQVFAKEKTSGVESRVSVRPSYGLSDDEVALMLSEGFAHAHEDMQLRALRESRVEAERMILATRAALAADEHLLSRDERRAIDRLVDALDQARQRDSAQEIDKAVTALAEGTEEFAALRMNQGIRRALEGRSVHDV